MERFEELNAVDPSGRVNVVGRSEYSGYFGEKSFTAVHLGVYGAIYSCVLYGCLHWYLYLYH